MAFPTACAFKLLTFLNLARASLPESWPRHALPPCFYPLCTPLSLHVPRSSAICSGVYPPRAACSSRQGHPSVFDSPAPGLAPRPFIRFTLSSTAFNSSFPKGCEGRHREAGNGVEEINMKMLGGEEKTGRVGRGPVLLSPAGSRAGPSLPNGNFGTCANELMILHRKVT